MTEKLLKDIKVGEYFTLKAIEEPTENQVWVKDSFDRSTKKYDVYKFADVNHFSQKKGTTKVYVGFTF